MKEHDSKKKELIALLKESGLEKPSELFSERLTYRVVHPQRRQFATETKAEKWLGKFILSVLVFFNLLFLYYLNPFTIQPGLFISVAAFVVGLWVLVGLARRLQSFIP